VVRITNRNQTMARALQKELGVADSGLAIKLDSLRPAIREEDRRGGGSDEAIEKILETVIAPVPVG